MQKFQDVVLDSQGRPVAGAVIAVQEYPGGGAATVYQTDAVGTAYEPTTDDYGAFYFYAADGLYSYTVTLFGTVRKTVTDIQIVDTIGALADKAGLDSGGYVSANGLAFPETAVPSDDAKTLDDYEEGIWTPRLYGASSAGVGTYTLQRGEYTKIGNLVTLSGDIDWSAHDGTGDMLIDALPFTSPGAQCGTIGISLVSDGVACTAGSVVCGTYDTNTNRINIMQTPSGGGTLDGVPMTTSGKLHFTFSYPEGI